MRSLLCILGFHKWKYQGAAQYGRGELYKCERCSKTDRLEISVEELEAQLDKEVKEIEARRPDWMINVKYIDGTHTYVCRYCKEAFYPNFRWECPSCKAK